MEEGIPLPKTDVSFAPTAAFVKAYPDEANEQKKKFNTPTWQQRTDEGEVKPTGSSRMLPSDPVFSYLHDDGPALVFGAIFFLAVAYLVARGVQWHIN